MPEIKFHTQFVFRAPLCPINTVYTDLKSIAATKEFQEAIYLASPVLYDETIKWLNNKLEDAKEEKKLIYSLHKYLSRISTRCTPYGLFAGCSTGAWGEKSEIHLNDRGERHTRLDMNFVCGLSQNLARNPEIRSRLLFYPNNSLYTIGEQFRYVEYRYVKNNRIHEITSVDTNEFLTKILNASRAGEKLEVLAKLLVTEDIDTEEATDFINEIENSQILVSELEPAITGIEFIHQVMHVLQKINVNPESQLIADIIALLEDTESRINRIDADWTNEISVYRNLMSELKKLNVEIEEKFLLQVDTFHKTQTGSLNIGVQKKLLSAVDFLYKLNPSGSSQKVELENFKNRYNDVYGDAETSLLAVLDTETGIGYPSKDSSGINKLIDDIYIPGNGEPNAEFKWSQTDKILFPKLLSAFKEEKLTVEFNEEDVKGIKVNEGRLNPTLAMMFRMTDFQNEKIQFSGVTYFSSAANWLGRFGHGSKDVLNIIKDIAAFEQDVAGDRIIAEIVHLPESRMGNILLRPSFRNYEIPYLAQSSLPAENQIRLDDILVSVKNNRILLRSRRLNKEIIPHLTTAHNFIAKALPVYRFLGDMQFQDIDKPGLFFDWGVLKKMFNFLPRAEYKGVILAPATWQLQKKEYDNLYKSCNEQDFMHHAKKWWDKWKMPRFLLLKDADNELLIDAESELSIQTFLDTVKKRESIDLTEFLFDTSENSLIKNSKGKPYTNELLAFAFNLDYKKNSTNLITTSPLTNNEITNATRSFIPGSEWLFYKIYCGVKTADKILAEVIKPMVEYLVSEGLIERYFFIRYIDPDSHIRLRFYNKDITQIGRIIQVFYEYLNLYMQNGTISKISNDTYVRELERYGANSIEIAEEYFSIDSAAVLNLLSLVEGEEGEEIKWKFAARSINDLLDCFQLSGIQKMEIMEWLKDGFISEHGPVKDLKPQLDEKFRKLRPILNKFIIKKVEPDDELSPIMEILAEKKRLTNNIFQRIIGLKNAGMLQVDINSMLASYIHMHVNRIFKAKQRVHEMVIYDMLYRYYRSALAMEKKKNQLIAE
jgi:thiopeptide-type bacteriocin biosynthesis protein